jgi:hypothetical protein
MLLQRVYCARCRIHFDTFSAKLQHIKESRSHNVCHICFPPLDFRTMVELDLHLEAEHTMCIACGIQLNAPEKLVQHDINEHNMCVICRQYFDSPSALKSVCYLITH